MSNQVKVVDILSNTVLFQTSIEKIDEAYAFAAQMEEAGLDLKIEAPGLAETLIKSLGANEAELMQYRQSLVEEMEDHDQSEYGCGVCLPTKSDDCPE